MNAEGCNDNSGNVLFPQITFWVYSLLLELSGEEKLPGYKPLVCNFSKCLSL